MGDGIRNPNENILAPGIQAVYRLYTATMYVQVRLLKGRSTKSVECGLILFFDQLNQLPT